jgi:hypothetical protein
MMPVPPDYMVYGPDEESFGHPDPAEEIVRIKGERDRQYEYNVEQIARQAALEAEIARLREVLESIELMARDYLHVSTPPEDTLAAVVDQIGLIRQTARSALSPPSASEQHGPNRPAAPYDPNDPRPQSHWGSMLKPPSASEQSAPVTGSPDAWRG